MKYTIALVSSLLVLAGALSAETATRDRAHGPGVSAVASTLETSIWKPGLVTSWQWQLTTPVDQTVNADVFDIDLYDNSASVVSSLHAKGKKVICYISAGTFEN